MQYGVSYWDTSGGIAAGNNCSGNTESGLAFRGSESYPRLIGNICNNNGYSGIDLYGEISVTAAHSTYSENIYHCISVGGYSYTNLLKNICHTNKEVGIVFFEESSGAVISNECYGNEYGIYIQPDASPDLIDNILENNTVEDIEDKR